MNGMPRLFLNSIPKSGTHLLQQIVLGMPNLRIQTNGQYYEGYPSQLNDQFKRLRSMKPGEVGAGHVYYSDTWAHTLRRLKIKSIFIVRDPRDSVVSLMHFIVNQHPQHELHPYFVNQLQTSKQRFLTLIHGVRTQNVDYPGVVEWHDRFLRWRSDPNILTIKYEDLMTNPQTRKKTLEKIFDFVWKGRTPPYPKPIMIQLMENHIDPKKSATFRKGQIGNWKHEFDNETKQVFKEVAGRLLIGMGYERDFSW
jgi:hypothetical protein